MKDTLNLINEEDEEKYILNKFWEELKRRNRVKAKVIRERNKSRVPNLLVRVVDILENRVKNTDFDTTKNIRRESEKSNKKFVIESKSDKEKEEKNNI